MTFASTDAARRLTAPLLSLLLVVVPYASAQQPVPAPVKPIAPATENLKIIVLAGQKEQNDLPRRVMAPLVVQVLDQSDIPIDGAQVTFFFPASGPSATFEGEKVSQTIRTDAGGQARASNWSANNRTGKFQVHVTATLGNQTGQTNVTMYNVTRVTEKRGHRWWTGKKVALIVIIAAAGTAAGILLTRSSGGSDTTPVTISIGTPTLGGAH